MRPVSAILLLLVALCVGCQTHTPAGKCIGVNDPKDPILRYEVSTRNVVMGIIFFELVAPPIIVVVDEFYCPVGEVGT